MEKGAWVLATVYELGSKEVAKAVEVLLNHGIWCSRNRRQLQALWHCSARSQHSGIPIA